MYSPAWLVSASVALVWVALLGGGCACGGKGSVPAEGDAATDGGGDADGALPPGPHRDGGQGDSGGSGDTSTPTGSDGEPDSDAASVPDAEPDSDAASVPDAEPDSDAATVPDGEPDSDAATVPDGEPDSDAATVPDGGPDSDGDGVLDDGDGSGTAGDGPCPDGVTSECDDNCPSTENPGQGDVDGDGLGDLCDPDPWPARDSTTIVAVGRYSTIGYSTDDGATWSAATIPPSPDTKLEGLAYGDGTWVAVGNEAPLIFVSGDAREWTVIADEAIPGGAFDFETVAFGAGVFVAAGVSGRYAYSDDAGETWNDPGGRILDGYDVENMACAGGGRCVAVGDRGQVGYTDDPSRAWNWTWQSITALDLQAVAYNRGTWVLVGDGGTVFTSTNGAVDWTASRRVFVGEDVEAIAPNYRGQWMIAGADAFAALGEPGDWTEFAVRPFVGAGSSRIRGVFYEGGSARWLTVGSDGRVAYSDDQGENWIQADSSRVFRSTLYVVLGD